MKRIFAFLVLLALVVPWARGADAVDVYLRGEMNGWECLEEYRFATTDGVNYTLTVPDYTAGHEFKIASADWYTVNYGGESQNFAIIPDFECQLYPSDYNLIISNDLTDVTFNFNLEEGTIFVTGNPVNASGSYDYDLYVIGLNVNGQAWVVGQEDAKFTYEGDGIFSWSGEQLGDEFKLNDGTWMDETHNWGGNGGKLALGEPYQLISGESSSNIILEGGTTISNPHIVFDAKTETIVVTRSFDQNSPDTSADNPMSVDEMLDNGVPQTAQCPVYLNGYIVGYAPGDDMSSAVFSSGEGDYAKTNIILASNRNEDDYIFCVPVELPAGDVRNALNIVDNPANLGTRVTVRGSWERYLQGNGLKSVDWYSIDTPTEPDNFTISIDPAPGTYSELPETFTVTFSGTQDGKTLASIGRNIMVANPVLIYLPDSESRYQCAGTFQGNTLTVTTNESVDRKLKGDYKFEIRAGGVYFVWDDDTKTKSESSTYTFTVEPEETHAVRLLSADPADGSTVESLKSIKTYWSTEGEDYGVNYDVRVSVYDSDSQTEVTQGELQFDWYDASLFTIILKDEITAPGNYTVMIPENALMDESGNGVGEAATLNYHIRKNIQHEVTFNGSNPADGSILDSLSEIAIAWNVETDEYNLTDESAIHLFNVTDNVEIPIYDIYSFTDITNDPLFIVGMDIEPEIVKAGEYELTIPDGFLRDMDGNTYGEGITLHYTIRQNAANTVATPTISLEVAADARSVEVTLSTDTEDATLWYGIDNDGTTATYGGSLNGSYEQHLTDEPKAYPYTLNYTITNNYNSTLTISVNYDWSDGEPIGIAGGFVLINNALYDFIDATNRSITTTETYNVGEVVSIKINIPVAGGMVTDSFEYTVESVTMTEYSAPFTLTQNGTVYAQARKEGLFDSEVVSHEIDLLTVSAPVIVYDNRQVVIIPEDSEGVVTYYTLDGTEPVAPDTEGNNGNGSIYTSPLTLTSDAMVRARSYRENFKPSPITTYSFAYIDYLVTDPSISLEVAADARSVKVTLSTDTEDATLWYGIDNDDPEAMTEYSAPFTLTQNGTVYAQARKEGLFDSEVVSHEVSGLTAGKVSFSYDGRYMTLSSDDETEVHYHTGDGNWRPYTQPFDMKGLNTVYAYSKGEGIDNSAEVSYTAKSYGREGEAYLSKGGSLLEAYLWTTNEEIDSWTEMTLHGYLYDYDYQWLRLRENIETLDLSDVTVDNAYNIPNSAFANMSMVTVRLPKTFSATNVSSATANGLIRSNIFSNCKNLAAIYWDATVSGDGSTLPMPESLVSSITNKNTLIYTNSETSVLTVKNVINNIVIGGRAEKLILTEGGGLWYCPEAFTADKVRYVRSFTKTTGVNGECAGWETIALPFDVQSITHDKGNLHPFAEDVVSNMRFWLFSPATPDWEPVSEIRANNPYLIAMPNNATYDEAFSLAGDVTFSAENVQIPATPDEMSFSLWDDMMMTPNFQNLEADGSLLTVNDTYYNGNNPGSMFVGGVRDVRPFEAYLTGGTRRAIPIFDPSRTDTSSLLPTFADASICVEVTAEGLRLMSLRDRTVEVFSSTGVRVAVATLRAAEPQTLRLVPGIYIVAGRKVLL